MITQSLLSRRLQEPVQGQGGLLEAHLKKSLKNKDKNAQNSSPKSRKRTELEEIQEKINPKETEKNPFKSETHLRARKAEFDQSAVPFSPTLKYSKQGFQEHSRSDIETNYYQSGRASVPNSIFVFFLGLFPSQVPIPCQLRA
mmetsp:Transcript_29232/g.113424  ORF Transcript_29232/g.113424 Transcript_29232/m.113424 type:complete len:143 (-) Transcript_29232:140-568(-)